MHRSTVKPNIPPKSERHRRFGSVDPIPGEKPTQKDRMSDLQNVRQDYLFAIDQVGICKVKHPINVRSDLAPQSQTSIAEFTLTTSLDADSKGINMSRLTEQLESYRHNELTADLPHLLRFAQELAERMNQSHAKLVVSFPWFYERPSPVTELRGLNHATVTITAEYGDGKFKVEAGLQATVTTLCPCSKEISEYSAHNQRGVVTMVVELNPEQAMNEDWKTVLLHAAESNASSLIHPILKRPDEKRVTETAYENPRFVEDMVRLVAADLYECPEILAFRVECRNEESIHLHDALASLAYDKRTEAATR